MHRLFHKVIAVAAVGVTLTALLGGQASALAASIGGPFELSDLLTAAE